MKIKFQEFTDSQWQVIEKILTTKGNESIVYERL